MPSPDKLFRLDPVETKITAPTTNFQVLAEAADRSVANRSLGRGLTAFSQALGGLAQFKKQEQIRDDIKTAKDAAVRGEVMPNVLPVAETAYQNVIDKNTASESLLAIERFENGDDFDTLIKSETPSDQKTSQIEASYDDFYARAVQSMQNPDLIQNLRLTINGLKEKAYQKVYERERDIRNIEGIHGLKNTLNEAKRFAEGSGVALIDTLTPNWVQANAKDLGKSHPYLSLPERKLLAFQTLTTDIDVLGDPQIIEEIMKSSYNKGFTFRNLYEGIGEDAEEFQKIYNAYVQNSKDYFTKLDADAKDSNENNIAQFKDTIRQEYIEAGLTSAKGISKKALDSGLFDEAKAIKLEKDTQEWMDTNTKFQEGSAEDIAMVDFILNQGVTLPTQIDDLVLKGRLNPALAPKYKSYLKEENKQKLAFIGKYKEYVKDIAKNALSLSKLTLGNKIRDILGGVDRDVTPAEMMRAMLGKGLPHDQVNNIIGQVQDFHNGLNAEAEKMGIEDSVADRADGAIPFEHLQKFQLRVENQVNQLVVAIDKGLESRPDTREVNLPSLEFPVISTGDEFPLVVNQTKNIFETITTNDLPVSSSNLSKTGADISPASGSITFDVEQSFMQSQNMTMRSYVLDATTKNWPKPLSDVVVAIIEQEKKDKAAEPDTPLKQAIRRKQETLDNIDTWFSDLGEDLGMVPGFLKELFTPGLDMKTGKQVQPVSPEERVKRKRETLDNIDKTIVDSGKNLLNLMKSIVGVGEAEGAATSQDADFDPTAKGPRGFDKDNQPIEGTRNELAKKLGLPPDLSEDRFKGGTSEESDIEGFTGEDVDMPPVVMDEIVVSEKAKPSVLSGLPKETQEDIKRQLENERRNPVFEQSLMEKELGKDDQKTFKGKPYVSYNFAKRQGLSGKDRKLSTISNIPTAVDGKTGLTIGFGHDVTPQELNSGKIAGISFIDKNGNFIDLSNSDLQIIFRNDFKTHKKIAEKHFNNKSFGVSFNNVPKELQLFLTERAFSTGTNPMPNADAAFKKALGLKESLSRSLKDKRINKKSKAYNLQVKELKKAVDSFIFNVKERPVIQPRVDALFKISNAKDALYRFFKLQGK